MLPQYQCHKKVWALRILSIEIDSADSGHEMDRKARLTPFEDGYPPQQVSLDYIRKHNPQIGGYFVVYDDGYMSYSPQKAFEEGYTRIT